MKKDKDGTYTYNGYKVDIENGRVDYMSQWKWKRFFVIIKTGVMVVK